MHSLFDNDRFTNFILDFSNMYRLCTNNIVLTPREIKRKIEKVKYSDYIMNFYKTLSRNFALLDMSLFSRNIAGLNIIHHGFAYEKIFKHSHLSGEYLPLGNTIKINKHRVNDSIYHELFHMASTYCSKDEVIHSGFSVQSPVGLYSVLIGVGFTEGYTEVLNKRYFQDETYDYSYQLQAEISFLTEQLIGRKKMESLYINADLKGFVQEFSKYADVNQIINFIRMVDKISKNMDYQEALANFEKIYSFLIESYIRKEMMNCISFGEVKERVKSYAKKFPDSFYHKNNYFEIDTLEIVERECNGVRNKIYLKNIN